MNQLLQHLLQNVHQQKRDHPCEGERMPHWKINISFVLFSQWTNPFHDGLTETVTSNYSKVGRKHCFVKNII